MLAESFVGNLNRLDVLHLRFGHQAHSTIVKLYPELKSLLPKIKFCDACAVTKQVTKPVSNSVHPKPTHVGELIPHDFVPFKMLSAELRRKRGTVGNHVFVDGFTAILLIRPVPSKAQIGLSVVYLKRFVETQTGRPVQLLRSDFENINLVDVIRKECDNTGTKLQASAPYRK